MKKISAILLVLSTIALTSWNCQKHGVPFAPSPVPTATTVPVCTPGSGVSSLLFSQLPLDYGSIAVIRTLNEWNAYWATTANPPALPSVNFASQMMLLQTYPACGIYTIDQVCYANGGWTVSETAPSTFPYPCDPIDDNSQALILGASSLPVTILVTQTRSNLFQPSPVVIFLPTPTTPVATPTPLPVIVPTPYVTVVP